MGIVEELYGDLVQDRIDSWNQGWRSFPFKLFHPQMYFFDFKAPSSAIAREDNDFFTEDIRKNFFPDKSDEEVLEGMRYAMNRGIRTLNELCQIHLPSYADLFYADEIDAPFYPAEYFATAKEMIHNNKYNQKRLSRLLERLKKDPETLRAYDPKFEEKLARLAPSAHPIIHAYESIRAWGLGHFILTIDESPEIFNSVRYGGAITKWMDNQIKFNQSDRRTKEGLCEWDSDLGTVFYGTKFEPYKTRTKIYDASGKVKYDSLLMKMFSKRGFMDRINDSYGVEFTVGTEKDVEELISFFRYEVRGTSVLEKFEHVKDDDPPFEAYKFVVRPPIRVDERGDIYSASKKTEDSEEGQTIKLPLQKYVRIPVEVQIRTIDSVRNSNHKGYKKKQFMEVFPLWYPLEIYGPFLETPHFR